MKLFLVVTPGMFTTIQDQGRFGFQEFGIPKSGAMDDYAFTVANLLVGNRPNEAGLEITLLGPKLKFLSEAQIALTGGSLVATLNGRELDFWQTIQVRKDDILSIGTPVSGCRAYLAVRGNIDIPIVLGSKSTYIRGRFGGYKGRKLATNDLIEFHPPDSLLKHGLSMPENLIPHYDRSVEVKALLGPQHDLFDDSAKERFFSTKYEVTPEVDRMGYRLKGPKVEWKKSVNMLSDAVPTGAIQIPESGNPIIIMRDGQTTGGYPKIAVATTCAITRLGQVKPGDELKFSHVSLQDAQKELRDYKRTLNQIESKLLEASL